MAPLGLAGVLLPGQSLGQGADNPNNADAIPSSATSVMYDTDMCSDTGVGATTSLLPTFCSVGNDVWFTWTAPSSGAFRISNCGATFDTAIGVWDGNPMTTGNFLTCEDDNCSDGLSSLLSLAAQAGTTYWIQLGNDGDSVFGQTGAGVMTIEEFFPPTPPTDCLFTGLAGGNEGQPGGAVFFTVVANGFVTIEAIETHVTDDQNEGNPVNFSIFTFPNTHEDNETSTAWTLVATDDGSAVSAGFGFPTRVNLDQPFTLSPGSTCIAIVAEGCRHIFTNTGTTGNQVFSNSDMTITLGSASDSPFIPGAFVSNFRDWNGSLCQGASGPIGTPYCLVNPNSTGQLSTLEAVGSNVALNNDLLLTASQLPENEFAYVIASRTQGFVANPNNSQGNLCILGNLARFNLPSQLGVTTGGLFDFAVPLDNIPEPPSGPVVVLAGDTWSFQLWHRDFLPGTGPTSNFTNGYEILFQ